VTFVTVLILTTPFFSSSIIPTLVPTSTSAAVERVVGADEPPNPVTPVAVRTDDTQNSTNPTQDISPCTTSSHDNAPANETVVDSASTRVANPDSVRTCVNSLVILTRSSVLPINPWTPFSSQLEVQPSATRMLLWPMMWIFRCTSLR
jgi:hypothetical protein